MKKNIKERKKRKKKEKKLTEERNLLRKMKER